MSNISATLRTKETGTNWCTCSAADRCHLVNYIIIDKDMKKYTKPRKLQVDNVIPSHTLREVADVLVFCRATIPHEDLSVINSALRLCH